MWHFLDKVKIWFFELIEDSVGAKPMKKYRDEMDKKNKPQENNE